MKGGMTDPNKRYDPITIDNFENRGAERVQSLVLVEKDGLAVPLSSTNPLPITNVGGGAPVRISPPQVEAIFSGVVYSITAAQFSFPAIPTGANVCRVEVTLGAIQWNIVADAGPLTGKLSSGEVLELTGPEIAAFKATRSDGINAAIFVLLTQV